MAPRVVGNGRNDNRGMHVEVRYALGMVDGARPLSLSGLTGAKTQT